MAKCRGCEVTKLPNEFPPESVTDVCEHPTLVCLQCTVKYVETHAKCPECQQTVAKESQRIKFFSAMLKDMFKVYDEQEAYMSEESELENVNALYITLLTGECISVQYKADKTISHLKQEIMEETNHEPGKQKLLYKDVELKEYVKGKKAILADFQVQPNSSICLVIRLMSIPKSFDNVVFDLFWGYPYSVTKLAQSYQHTHSRDYLDATCFLYEGKVCKHICDYKSRNPIPAIRHSGDIMDDIKAIGHHTINVSLKKVPPAISHLFFTLSAWSSPSIARYPKPSLKFYKIDEPNQDLCKTTFTHANHSQAVVMCSVTKNSDGIWEIFQSGKCSAGNAKNYLRLKQTIMKLIESGQY